MPGGPEFDPLAPLPASAVPGASNAVNGEIVVRVETAPGVNAFVDNLESGNRNIGITANVGRRPLSSGGW